MSIETPTDNDNLVVISYSAVAFTDEDGKLYAKIPTLDRVYMSFTKPDSREAKWITHSQEKRTNVAHDLIQLYSGDYIPTDTRDLGGLRNSSWKVKRSKKGLVDVVGTYDLDGQKKHR